MGKKWIISLLFTCLLALVSSADVEFWSTDTFQLSAGGFNIIPEFRVRNNLTELYYFQTYIGPSYVLNKQWKINLFYGYKTSKSGTSWTQSNFVYSDFIYSVGWLANRFRWEYDATNSILKYRNQLQLKLNSAVLSDEFFYNLNHGLLDENRLLLGWSAKIAGIDSTIGYLIRGQRSSITASWTNSAAIVFNTSTKI